MTLDRWRYKNTRIAYYQAIGQFPDWCQRAGFSNLEDMEPIHVAAYIESHKGSAATIKQHMTAIRMMFSSRWRSDPPSRMEENYAKSSSSGCIRALMDGWTNSVVATSTAQDLLGRPALTLRKWAPGHREALLRRAARHASSLADLDQALPVTSRN